MSALKGRRDKQKFVVFSSANPMPIGPGVQMKFYA